VRDQLADHGGLAFGRRPHQSGLFFLLLARIHMRAVIEQQLCCSDIIGARYQHQGCLSVGAR